MAKAEKKQKTTKPSKVDGKKPAVAAKHKAEAAPSQKQGKKSAAANVESSPERIQLTEPVPAPEGDQEGGQRPPTTVTATRRDTLAPAVQEFLTALSDTYGAGKAATILQTAIRDCGQRVMVDGKLGPVTIRFANRVSETALLQALQVRADTAIKQSIEGAVTNKPSEEQPS